MHYINLILFLLFLSSKLTAQVSLEVMAPVGFSSYAPASLDRLNIAIGPNDYTYKNGISSGLDIRLSKQHNKNSTSQFAFRYRRMQQRFVESHSRDSYSWTFRETRIRTAEHLLGAAFNFRYAIFHFPNSKLSAQISAGILYPIAQEGWVRQERRSFYNNETEHYRSYSSEGEEYLMMERYLNAGIAVVYSLGSGPLSWVFEGGYEFSYFKGEDWKRSETSAFDWNNFYIGIGTNYYLHDIKSPNDLKKE